MPDFFIFFLPPGNQAIEFSQKPPDFLLFFPFRESKVQFLEIRIVDAAAIPDAIGNGLEPFNKPVGGKHIFPKIVVMRFLILEIHNRVCRRCDAFRIRMRKAALKRTEMDDELPGHHPLISDGVLLS